jgi:uncharacterized protein YndB with AHSA1/START domain/predicted SnoaL-like aldol condensation-catalyzing enzyme
MTEQTAAHIVEQIEIAAPLARVWQALTDYRAFGEWFGVALDGPFVVGERLSGKITSAGYEGLPWEARVVSIEPMHTFAYRWPTGADAAPDETESQWTLVEFHLESIPTGTRLTLTESGFEKVPTHRRDNAFRLNAQGWQIQSQRIQAYVLDLKHAAARFLQQVASGEVQAAYDSFVAPDFIHHNPYFKGDRQSLLTAMQADNTQSTKKQFQIKQSFAEGQTVIIHAHLQLGPDTPGAVMVYILRFEKAQIVELWDIGQPIEPDSPNQNGMF